MGGAPRPARPSAASHTTPVTPTPPGTPSFINALLCPTLPGGPPSGGKWSTNSHCGEGARHRAWDSLGTEWTPRARLTEQPPCALHSTTRAGRQGRRSARARLPSLSKAPAPADGHPLCTSRTLAQQLWDKCVSKVSGCGRDGVRVCPSLHPGLARRQEGREEKGRLCPQLTPREGLL